MDQISANIFSNLFNLLNNSKLFSAFIMIFMNLGSKYISFDMCNFHEKILSNFIVRKLAIFAIFWTATRDTKLSLVLTLAFSFIISGLFNDKSFLCIIPKKNLVETQNQGTISPEEYQNAQKIINIYQDQKKGIINNYNQIEEEEKKKINTYRFNKWKLRNSNLNS